MSNTIGLQIAAADGKTSDAVFDSDSILIGSGPSAVLRLDDPDVSSIHAVVKVTPEGEVTIIDLGSEGGTTVNGNAVTEPTTLKVGDAIAVGGVKLTITQLGAAAPAAAPRVADLVDEDATVAADEAPKAEAPVAATPEVKASAEPVQKPGADLPTQRIRERKANTNVVKENDDFEPHLLTTPLGEKNEPTNEQHALEVTFLWGDTVLDAAEVAQPRAITAGIRPSGFQLQGGRKYDLEVDALPADNFTIAVNQGTEAQIVVPADAKVGLRKKDGTTTTDVSLSPTDAPFPAKAYQLKMGERLVYKSGTLTVMAQYVRGNAAFGAGAVMDWYFPRVFAISALLHIFFVAAAFITPHTNSSMVDELFKNQNRFAQMILKAPEEEKKRKKLDLSGMKGGAKHKGDEGKFGKKDKPKKDALASKAGAPRVDPNKREKDRKIAMNSGLLGILKGAGEAGAVSNVFGPGGLGTGINNAMGGLRGTAMGDAGGAGGLGTRGTGAGGGGNSLGIGGLGTHGHGRGTGGYGNIDLGGRGKGTTRIVPGRTIIKGSLSKEEIGRVIRRNLARFKYCYEKQLNANPNLSGKISIYFTIAPTGSVAAAKVRETSMNDKTVEACTVKVMRSLKFPKPRGGGIVVVTYPFVFAAT
ncbi:MAG: AgmX/PglI C-terminal domain-containing protein [Deltaproteobacteria bacterium]